MIHYSHSKLGCLNFIDILLNHTAAESEWLNLSKDAYYNIHNTPHLNPALKLDLALKQFSQDFLSKNILTSFEGQPWTFEKIDTILVLLQKEYI